MNWGNLGRLHGGRGISTLKVKLEVNSKRLTEGSSRWKIQPKQKCGRGNMNVFSVFNLRQRCNLLIASFHDAPTHRALAWWRNGGVQAMGRCIILLALLRQGVPYLTWTLGWFRCTVGGRAGRLIRAPRKPSSQMAEHGCCCRRT